MIVIILSLLIVGALLRFDVFLYSFNILTAGNLLFYLAFFVRDFHIVLCVLIATILLDAISSVQKNCLYLHVHLQVIVACLLSRH